MTSSRNAASLRLPIIASSLVIATLSLGGCVTGGPRLVTPQIPAIPQGGGTIPQDNTVVLTDGTQVVANTAAGKMKIEAGPGLRRVFDWDGMRRGAITIARKKAFAGGDYKGISFDGKPKVWKDAKGIDHLRYEEGRRDFQTKEDALIWMQIRRLYYTWNDDGLVVGWRREGQTLHVELWQFYIDGKKPTSLPDARDADITEGKLVVEPQKMYPQLVFADGHTEPYNTDTASQYKGAGTSSKTTASSSSSNQCKWFERLFGKCTPASTVTSDSKTDSSEAANTPAASASNSTPPVSSPAASGGAVNSTAGDHAATDAPRATVAGNVVNIRSRPSTHSDVLLKAKKGDSVVILKKDRGWRYVKFDDGRKGWVADFLLKH
ncbi:MAG: SH3 domain-containing protein [Salinisphaera sp.]|jgi:hypothetical protein|nr:SH3 domain-containing protein [Salinisphaera sp.]